MKKLIFVISTLFLLSSCSSEFELNNEIVEKTYIQSDRSINLQEKNIKNYANLNSYMSGTEVNNIYLQNNDIQRLDISSFDKLARLDISNNDIRFLNDLKLPTDIRHLNVSGNNLDDLVGLENYLNLKTLDISFNNLEDNDIDLTIFPRLLFVNIDWNNVSVELINKVNEFNALYLSQNKKPFSE